MQENLGDAARQKLADELLSSLVGMNRRDCGQIFEAKTGSLQTKEVSLFQIRQYYSGDKGEPDVPH
jgi:hypothetical protein